MCRCVLGSGFHIKRIIGAEENGGTSYLSLVGGCVLHNEE
jgi:hypothetical protein